MRENNRKPIEKCRKKLPQFTTMNVIDGQAGLMIYFSLIFYSLTIDNILNIIVLLILAGVTIATLTGENGILAQAENAKEQTEIAQIKEQSQIDIGEKQSEKKSSEITEDELKEILENYGDLEGEGDILDKTLVTENGYKIPVREIYNGTITREPVILEVGDYVRYDVTYTDIYTGNNFTSETGWRVLETGTNNGDGTYTGLKLISTGIPGTLNFIEYGENTIENKVYNGEYGNWAGNETQRNEYAELFWSSYNNNNDNPNMYAAAGMYYNFTKIRFSRELNQYDDELIGEYEEPNDNEAYYININGQTEGELEENAFLKNGATRVYNLTLAELNTVRGESDLRSEKEIADNDGAKGLFKLGALGEYGYNNEISWNYYLASPDTRSNNVVYFVNDWYGVYIANANQGIRPVVELPDNYQVEKIN